MCRKCIKRDRDKYRKQKLTKDVISFLKEGEKSLDDIKQRCHLTNSEVCFILSKLEDSNIITKPKFKEVKGGFYVGMYSLIKKGDN